MKPFFVRNMGASAEDAFRGAVKMAKIVYGEGAGTIADKTSFIEIDAPEKREAQFAQMLIESHDARFYGALKPAGAIPLAKPEWLFFGWA